MNKIKLMFTSVAVLLVVGSALALTPRAENGDLYCRPKADGTGACPTTHLYKEITNGTEMYCRLASGSGNCASLKKVAVDD